MLTKIIAGIICFLSTHYGYSQKEQWFVKASFLKESFFYPAGINFTTPFHPGFFIGVENHIIRSAKWSNYFGGGLGFYHHPYFQNGLLLIGEYGWGYQLIPNLQISGSGIAGYLHVFQPTEVYELQDGEYVKVKNLGKPNALLGINVGVAYVLDASEKYALVLDYSSMASGPFNIYNGMPVIPITFIRLGVKMKFKQ